MPIQFKLFKLGKALLVCTFLFSLPCLLHSETYWVSTEGLDSNPGSQESPFRNISKAALIARAGDTVMVRSGVYRERVIPNRGGLEGKPIVYMSEHKHGAIIRGSDIWEPEWIQVQNGIYGAIPDPAMFTDSNYVDGGNPYLINYHCNRPPHPYKSVSWTLGQVFVNGDQYREVSNILELTSGSECWYYNAGEQRIEIQFGVLDPASQIVEITTRRGVFRPVRPSMSFIEIHGFVMEHCGNQLPYRFWDSEYEQNAQSGMLGTRGGHHWTIKDNIIRYAKSIGLDICKLLTDNEVHSYPTGSADAGYHLIEGNVFYANGTCGIMGMHHKNVTISNNVFVENNYYRHTTYEVGAAACRA